MRIEFAPFDNLHYLMDLHLDSFGGLKCATMGDKYYLVLRVPYQQDVNIITPQIFQNVLQYAAEQLGNSIDRFVKVGENAELGIFSKAAVMTGALLFGVQNTACTYAMFVCDIGMQDTGEKLLTVYYSPKGLFAVGNACNIPAVVKYRMYQDKVIKHRREKLSGYYVVEFFGVVDLDCGKIWYNIPGSKIDYPINSAMLRQKRIYIKSDVPPVFQSTGGVRIEPA